MNKNTEFFTTENPDDILDELVGYFEEKKFKVLLAEDKYRVKVALPADQDQDSIEMNINIMKAGADKYCVDF